ncbi:MAG TPA: TatD family deoxyribonuclease [Candidatus Hydrogenedentes bacterium]|nr:TatD family deoxyribonuclease [Candidatus Hydrogenedentota bacterium]
MGCVDTHCHLQMAPFDGDRVQTLDRALRSLEWIVVVGDNLETSRAAWAMSGDRVHAVVGCHPYHAGSFDDAALAGVRELARRPRVVAIGETGLDYFNEFSPRALQRPCFERQLALAAELGLPAVVHSRAAHADTAAILREHAPRLKGCVMHCFGGDASFAGQCLELGCYISFAGNLTFPKASALREAALAVPVDRLLVETDAPYLAPQCHRGKRCEPAYVTHTLDCLASLKGLPAEDLGEQIILNACAVFNLPRAAR